MTLRARPRGTIDHRGIRGLAAAGLLCAALAGCGAAAAATIPPASAAGGAPLAAGAGLKTGCASVKEATSVTIERTVLAVEPINGGSRTHTQRRATLVRAVFGDFCAVLAHAGTSQPTALCAAKYGTSYAGTFYDGQRTLATFIYSLRGCPRLSLTASGTTRGALVIGKAAAAAPHLKADLAAVLGAPQSQV
ncbi:MAG: hypothetical protein ACRDOU_11200 [Streptosporangiaceae bacterium]